MSASHKRLTEELRDEFTATTDYRRRLSLLTMSPFNIEETAKYFGTSIYMARKSRQLRESSGLLPDVERPRKGARLSDDVKERVKSFYESEMVSRMCAGRKDCLTVRGTDGDKTKVQKRLLLGCLRDIYTLFKEDVDNPRIGFSSFAALRPRYCVSAGTSGTHAVCICTHHPNPKLMLCALDVEKVSVNDLISQTVCSVKGRDCMM